MSWIITGTEKLDPDAQAYIGRVEQADQANLEPAVKDAINAFVVGCKADGTWEKLRASAIFGGARTVAGALMPLVGPAPTDRSTDKFVAADYNRKTGLKNPSIKFIDTNYKISNFLTGENLHMGLYGTEGLNTGRPMGVFRASVYTRHYLVVDTFAANNAVGWGVSTSASNLSAGHYIVTRETGGIPVRYLNGAQEVTLNYDDSTPSDWTVTLFVAHGSQTGNASEPESFIGFSSARIAFYHIGTGLNATQAQALSNRRQDLFNAFAAAIP